MRAFLIVLLLASCGEDEPVDEARWHLLGEQRPSSLLAVWASSLEDVWVVGGREAVGMGPSVFHYDGAAWSKLDTGEIDIDLWSVFGFENDAVFFGGSNGTILRYRAGAFEKLPTPSTEIVFGLWGSSPDDVWAVGGQTSGGPFIWRYEGTAFERLTSSPAELGTGVIWSVTGRAADDVWMSASRGLVLHWDGIALSNEQIGGPSESLYSVGCHLDRCVTAGTNAANGVLYHNEGQGWTSRVPTADGPAWRGVTPTGEHAHVVGMSGAVIRLTADGWISEPQELTTKSLRATWVDADGNLFAVGGEFDRPLTAEGVLLYKGTADLPMLP